MDQWRPEGMKWEVWLTQSFKAEVGTLQLYSWLWSTNCSVFKALMEHRRICLFTFSLGLFLWYTKRWVVATRTTLVGKGKTTYYVVFYLKKKKRKNKKFPLMKTEKIYNILCHSSLKTEVTRLSVCCKRTFSKWKSNLSTRKSKNNDGNCLSKVYQETEMWGFCYSVNHNSQEFLCLD